MSPSTTDRIEKTIALAAPPSRVWRALSDHEEFGAWFGVALEGPIALETPMQGRITHPGCEHMMLRATVVEIVPERRLALRWCPYAFDAERDYTGEPTTLVEFDLEADGDGTRLTIVESGFDALPEEHRAESFVRNEGGWSEQVKSIERHVGG